jgi:hypothetical protein
MLRRSKIFIAIATKLRSAPEERHLIGLHRLEKLPFLMRHVVDGNELLPLSEDDAGNVFLKLIVVFSPE